jgi:spermidine/putrescine transport system ATP-binding protein
MSNVEIIGATKRYGEVFAADNVNLLVEDGEFFSLLGPSGCGKTTILRLIAGFIDPDSGVVRIDGADMIGVPPEKRLTGVVFQNYALFPHLTARENIAFGLSVRRVPRVEIVLRVDEALDMVELEGLGDRYPLQLSGGQQQRVALARALVTHPRVLLLDEPLGALDKKLRTQMQVELRQLQERLKITTIFVTHDQEEALTLSDRIAVMNNGAICQVGQPEHVYERPETLFVSNFLGQSNTFIGKLGSMEGQTGLVETDIGVLLRSDWCRGKKPGDPVILVVRPEKVKLTPESPTFENAIPAAIVHRAYLGTSTTYLLQPKQGDRITAFIQNERNHPAFEVGQNVYASWEAENCFLLTDTPHSSNPSKLTKETP